MISRKRNIKPTINVDTINTIKSRDKQRRGFVQQSEYYYIQVDNIGVGIAPMDHYGVTTASCSITIRTPCIMLRLVSVCFDHSHSLNCSRSGIPCSFKGQHSTEWGYMFSWVTHQASTVQHWNTETRTLRSYTPMVFI